jgi:hypothetical protein
MADLYMVCLPSGKCCDAAFHFRSPYGQRRKKMPDNFLSQYQSSVDCPSFVYGSRIVLLVFEPSGEQYVCVARSLRDRNTAFLYPVDQGNRARSYIHRESRLVVSLSMLNKYRKKAEWQPCAAPLFLRSSVTHLRPLRRQRRESAAKCYSNPGMRSPNLPARSHHRRYRQQGQVRCLFPPSLQSSKSCHEHQHTKREAKSSQAKGRERGSRIDDYAPNKSTEMEVFFPEMYPVGVRRSLRLQKIGQRKSHEQRII